MRIVVALGGNALVRRDDPPDETVQRHHVRVAAEALGGLARDHSLVVCHGNGPQIGLPALERANDTTLTSPLPLDDLGAQIQGMIGYWLVQELSNQGLAATPVALVTQVVVDERDPAFEHPVEFIGVGYTRPRRPPWPKLVAGRCGRTEAAGGEWSPRRLPRRSSSSTPSERFPRPVTWSSAPEEAASRS